MSNKYRNNSPLGGGAGTDFFGMILGGIICGVLALIGVPFRFFLAIAAIACLYKGIESVAMSKHDQSVFTKFKNLILGFLCLIFGGVSGIFDLIGVIAIIVFAINMINNRSQTIPNIPSNRAARNAARQQRRSERRGTGNTGTQTRHVTPTSYVPGSDNIYTQANGEDIIQSAKAFMQGKANTFTSGAGKTSPSYQKALDILKKDIRDIEQRETSVSSFLDDFFAGSTVSKSRYLQTIQNAKQRLETNYEKACQAVKLFGNSEPTAERMEILNRYVQDSNEIMNKVEKVIDELITVQANDVISDGDVLDGLLDDLANTTSYYQRSPYQKSDGDDSGFQMPG